MCEGRAKSRSESWPYCRDYYPRQRSLGREVLRSPSGSVAPTELASSYGCKPAPRHARSSTHEAEVATPREPYLSSAISRRMSTLGSDQSCRQRPIRRDRFLISCYREHSLRLRSMASSLVLTCTKTKIFNPSISKSLFPGSAPETN